MPQTDGTLAPIAFHSASASDYNAAVTDLSQRVQTANAQEANAEALAAAEHKIDQAAAAVSSALAALSNSVGVVNNNLGALPGSLKAEADEVAQTKAGDQNVQTEAQQHPDGNSGQVCYDASQVSYDASQVEYDATQVTYDATQIKSDLDSIQGGINHLGDAFAAFQSAENAVPGYHPVNPPSQDDVNQASANAASAESAARSRTNAGIDQANADVVTAYQYADEAARAGNCGSGPTTPDPQPHI